MPEPTSDESDDSHSRRGFNRPWAWTKRGEKVANRHGKKAHRQTRDRAADDPRDDCQESCGLDIRWPTCQRHSQRRICRGETGNESKKSCLAWQSGTAWINHPASTSKTHRHLREAKHRSEILRAVTAVPLYNQSAQWGIFISCRVSVRTPPKTS